METLPATSSHLPATTAPDTEPLSCPLCEYNLTGLTEPRCPECGHQFDWAELTDPLRRRHKWFFEHGPLLSSYLKTQLLLWLPWLFWNRVRPSFQLRPWRMAIFPLIGAILLVVLAVSGPFSSRVIGFHQQMNRDRLSLGATVTRAFISQYGLSSDATARLPPNPTLADVLAASQGMTKADYLKHRYPSFPSPEFWRYFFAYNYNYTQWRYLDFHLSFLLLVPPVTGMMLLGLMRQSFSRAKIRTVQLFRVALYSADPLILVVVLGIRYFHEDFISLEITGSLANIIPRLLLAQSVCFLPWLIRLHFGVRNYLGIPRAWSVTLAAWVMVNLLGMALIMGINQITH